MISLHELRCALFPVLLAMLAASGCTSLPPATSVDLKPPASGGFDYTDYSMLLQRYVNASGLVDYRGLAMDSGMLERFYAQIAAVSPDSHPHLFPQRQDRLAYWINAYNATVMHGVLHHYPIGSVSDVPAPKLFFFFPERSGFFFFQRFVYGGRQLSLYALENDVIRERFTDPRYHFALNCASLGCPELPRIPFLPSTLDDRLDQEAKSFINDPRHVRYDPQRNVLFLSSIFSWYSDDFLDVLPAGEAREGGLARYILPYLDRQTADLLRANPETVTIRFLDYDWRLNDQRGAAAGRSDW